VRRPRKTTMGLVIGLSLSAVPAVIAQPALQVVLSVGPAFTLRDLPAGTEVGASLSHVHAVVLRVTPGALAALVRVPGVRGVYPDRGLHATGSEDGGSDGIVASEAVDGAGDRTDGRGITVAVLDSGVADTEALNRSSGRLVRGPNYSGSSGDGRDGFGHGTFMATIVAGGSVDGRVLGVAPAAQVVDVKVADSDGGTRLSKVLKGLNWIADGCRRRRAGQRDHRRGLLRKRPHPGQRPGAGPGAAHRRCG
jgi:hypothetical protein